MSGKGSAPRKGQDHVAYSEGYDRIFRKPKITHVAVINSGTIYSLPAPNRHHHVIHANKLRTDCDEGFLLDNGDFVNRSLAYEIAKNNGQLKRRPGKEFYQGNELYSEDLW